MSTKQDNSGNEKIMSVAGPNSKGEYRVRITSDNDVHELITKTPPKGLKEEFRPSTSQAMNIQRQTRQKMNPGTNRFVWKRPNQIGGSNTENELKSLNFKYSAKYNMWGGTQQMWDQLTGKVNEFAPPGSVSPPVSVVPAVTANVLLAVNVANAPLPAVVPPIAPGAARFTFGANDQIDLISWSVYFACSGWCQTA